METRAVVSQMEWADNNAQSSWNYTENFKWRVDDSGQNLIIIKMKIYFGGNNNRLLTRSLWLLGAAVVICLPAEKTKQKKTCENDSNYSYATQNHLSAEKLHKMYLRFILFGIVLSEITNIRQHKMIVEISWKSTATRMVGKFEIVWSDFVKYSNPYSDTRPPKIQHRTK